MPTETKEGGSPRFQDYFAQIDDCCERLGLPVSPKRRAEKTKGIAAVVNTQTGIQRNLQPVLETQEAQTAAENGTPLAEAEKTQSPSETVVFSAKVEETAGGAGVVTEQPDFTPSPAEGDGAAA